MTTLQKSVSTHGIGLHHGLPVKVTLHPAAAGSGITFVRTDVPAGEGEFALTPDGAGAALVQPSPLHTLLKNKHGTTLATIEHLMAAFAGLAVTDVRIELDGPEVPILDGSALPWVNLIDQAGRTEPDANTRYWRVTDPLRETGEARLLEALPDGAPAATGMEILWKLEVHVHFPHPAIGSQSWKGVLDEATFRQEIAPARTFIEEDHLKAAQAAGLVKGASLAGGVLFNSQGGVTNPEGLRFADEPVRHKVLDALGDLYVGARVIRARFHLTAPGHAPTGALLRQVLAQNATV